MTSISEARAAITTNPHLLPAEREVLLGLDDTDLRRVVRETQLIVEEVSKLPDGLQSTLDDLAHAGSTGLTRILRHPSHIVAESIRNALGDPRREYPKREDDIEQWAWVMAVGDRLY
ncbi:hypothetical protein ACT17_22740 [Mycolicibacterium conceptionense]|uniref:Uncharacterized protein n=1 Tax=Mycolicibacterium conceptionense TaxID=451644 RepID=A0A0J8U4A0_9MYCO|nr:hypothetical protein [Mycolicibacterium conceptionense]KMV15917.1 hypothetical protein ACT17_22740 [Mycolicibacterium conceptionense]